MSSDSIFEGTTPAFPVPWFPVGSGNGLTKREYFAAMAMQGLLANTQWSDILPRDVADEAIKHADALLTALEAEQAPSAEASGRDFEVRQLAYEQGLNPDDSYG